MRKLFGLFRVVALVALAILHPGAALAGDQAAPPADKRAAATRLSFVPYAGHSHSVQSVCFNSDGTKLVTTANSEIRVWDIATELPVTSVAAYSILPTASFSPTDPTRLLVVDHSGVRVVDARNGNAVLTWKGPWFSGTFSSDGTKVFMTHIGEKSDPGTDGIYDATSGKSLLVFHGGMRFVEPSPDCTRCLTSSEGDHTLKIWDVATQTSSPLFPTDSKSMEDVVRASFSPDGRKLILERKDGVAHVVDVKTGSLLLTLPKLDSDGESFSPDGRYVVLNGRSTRRMSYGDKNMEAIRIYSAETGAKVVSLDWDDDLDNDLVLSHDGSKFVAMSPGGRAHVYSTSTGLSLFECPTGMDFEFSPDGREVAGTDDEQGAVVLDGESGRELAHLKGAPTSRGDQGAMTSDSSEVASFHYGGNAAWLWSTKTGRDLVKLTSDSGFKTVSFSPDGTRIVTTDEAGQVLVRNAQSGERLIELIKGVHVDDATYSEDGRQIMTVEADGYRLFDAKTGKPGIANLKVPEPGADVRSARLSPDGTRIVACNRRFGQPDTYEAQFWDVRSATRLAVLKDITSAEFTHDGSLLTFSEHHVLSLWNPATMQSAKVATFDGDISFLHDPAHTKLFLVFANGTQVYGGDGKPLAWIPAQVVAADAGGTRILTMTGSSDAVWDSSGVNQYTRTRFDDDSWVVTASDGRYDSSNGPNPAHGYFLLRPAEGYPEPMAFDQIDTRAFYYKDLISDVSSARYRAAPASLFDAKPYPSVETQSDGSTVRFRVIARDGGGIGLIRIHVDGDAVKTYSPSEIQSGKWSLWDGAGLLTPDAKVTVVAANGDNTLFSTGAVFSHAKGKYQAFALDKGDVRPLKFVGVAVGPQHYPAGLPPLSYCSQDAFSMLRAMATLARSVPGVVETDLYALTDGALPDDLKAAGVTQMDPSRAKFTELTARVKHACEGANTVMVVSFSGHGATVGQHYLFLTPDVTSGDGAYLSQNQNLCITDSDIFDLLRTAKGGKRFLVLDTCSAGAFHADTSMKDAHDEAREKAATVAGLVNENCWGLQVVVGCPEGAASFESDQLRHGILTYSVLQALREGDLGDASDPFSVVAANLASEACRDTVANGKDLGLAQSAVPSGVGFFPIGRMSKADREKAIDLPLPAPGIRDCVILDSNSVPAESFDTAFLDLLSSGARGSKVVRVSSKQAPNAWLLTGSFLARPDGTVILRLRLSREGLKPLVLPDLATTAIRAPKAALDAVQAVLLKK